MFITNAYMLASEIERRIHGLAFYGHLACEYTIRFDCVISAIILAHEYKKYISLFLNK